MNKIENIDKEIAALRERKVQLLKNKTIKCPKCEKRTALKNATIISNYHYVKPYGCTEGDYWTFSDNYHYYCNKCGNFTRTYIMSWEKKGESKMYLNTQKQKEEDDRVRFYNFTKEHYQYFGERLDSYSKGGTIDEIRAQDKKDKEARKERGW